MSNDRKEYWKSYYQAHKKEQNARSKAYYQAHKEEHNARMNAYYQSHKEECKSRNKAWRESHKEECKSRNKAWIEAHKEEHNEYMKDYVKADLNSLGQAKAIIRWKSNNYLKKYGKKMPGYEIHHCCTYTEPYKFIYCSKEMHLKIHQYLRDNNIEADSNHYAQIKHLLDDTVVLYGLEL